MTSDQLFKRIENETAAKSHVVADMIKRRTDDFIRDREIGTKWFIELPDQTQSVLEALDYYFRRHVRPCWFDIRYWNLTRDQCNKDVVVHFRPGMEELREHSSFDRHFIVELISPRWNPYQIHLNQVSSYPGDEFLTMMLWLSWGPNTVGNYEGEWGLEKGLHSDSLKDWKLIVDKMLEIER
jgi:hypothetical protein